MAKARKTPAFSQDPLWYKDAIIYQVHVKSFFDANNDGIGDFAGLTAKLDYIADLGVNTLWLLPFYPSPRRDDGYDIGEYKAVSPDYGTLAEARRFVEEAHRRGLRVITELVINHTSDQHPWFQRARRAKPGSAARNYYVWSETNQKYDGTRIIFLDTETSNWTWDPVAGAYFWHRFYSHQPDLNFDNPQVLRAVLGVMRFWLDMGVDGLRLDAIPYLVERDGTNNENLPETHEVLRKIRAELDRVYPDRMLLAEANQWPEDTRPYFGGMDNPEHGDECHMAFHFPLMPRMYMALAQEDRFPINDILRQTPEIPANCQWAIFLRNHDELTLEMVTDKERDYLWNHYAADRRARINLGIRRRLAPLMERDRRRVELLNSLLLSMPGTPVIYYGDEIGMGDNIYLGDRDGVRTPMQWSGDRNGGFSKADPASLVLPPVMDPLYGFQAVNVEAQQRDPHSLLNWMRRLLAVRRQFQAFGRGSLRMLAPANRRILAYLREHQAADGQSETILCVANLSKVAQAVELDLSAHAGLVPVEMLGGAAFPPIGELSYLLTLPPYGFYWFMLAPAERMPSWHLSPVQTLPELHTLVIKNSLAELERPAAAATLCREVLPAYLGKRRWFAGKDQAMGEVRLASMTALGSPHETLLAELEVDSPNGSARYLLPLGFLGEDEQGSLLAQQLAMARLRRGREVGLLTDAFCLDEFVKVVIERIRHGSVLEDARGQLRFSAGPALANCEIGETAELRYLSAEQSNSSVIVADKLVLKLLRRLSPGVHPELEMTRQLGELGFANIAPLLGEVSRIGVDGEPTLLMIAQGYLSNQGDAWEWTQNGLERAIRDALVSGSAPDDSSHAALAELEQFSAVLGRRLGQMHALLAQPSDKPEFAPQLIDAEQARQLNLRVQAQLDDALALLAAGGCDEPLARLRDRREALLARIEEYANACIGSLSIRVHGDLHLGQVLVVQGDACLIDFEGEPSRPLSERRALHSPYKDVGGMLRSFDYAAAMARRNAQSSDSSVTAEQLREAISEHYRLRAAQAFLAAYRESSAGIAHRWLDANGERAALWLFTLEKVLYEIAYEARNRPAWLDVPLRRLMLLLEEEL